MLLFLRRTQRIDPFNRDAVFLLHLVHEVVGFGKQEFSVQGEEAEGRAHLGSNIDEDHALRAKSGRDGHPISEGVECPAQNAFGAPGLRGDLQFTNFVFHHFLLHATDSSSLFRLAEIVCANAASKAGSAKLVDSSTRLRSVNFTTSPTTRSVGDGSRGARWRSETVVR